MKIILFLITLLLSLEASSLQNKLDVYNTKFRKNVSPNIIEMIDNDLAHKKHSKIAKRVPQVGEKAIDFTLNDTNNRAFNLYHALKEKPVVLFWYRGGWCPYCNMQLSSYQNYYKEISKYAQLVAISPEKQELGIETNDDNEIEYINLTDTNNTIAKKYKLVYSMQADLAHIIDERFDLKDYYTYTSTELPLTITYIINTDGTIVYAFINEDFTKRAEPSSTIPPI